MGSVTGMVTKHGGTPALIAERERQDWTRTMLRVDIATGTVYYGDDAEHGKESADVTERQMELIRLVVDEGLSIQEAEKRLGFRPGSGSWILRTAETKRLVVKVGRGKYEWPNGAPAAPEAASDAQHKEAEGTMPEASAKQVLETADGLNVKRIQGLVQHVMVEALRPVIETIDLLQRRVNRLEEDVNKLNDAQIRFSRLEQEVADVRSAITDLRKAVGQDGIATLAIRLLAAERGIVA